MMIDINQTNVHLLIPGKVSWMVGMLTDDENVSLKEALQRIYTSDTYHKLERESTKYWYFGPVDLYRELTTTKILTAS